jgi:hypothetical protein
MLQKTRAGTSRRKSGPCGIREDAKLSIAGRGNIDDDKIGKIVTIETLRTMMIWIFRNIGHVREVSHEEMT